MKDLVRMKHLQLRNSLSAQKIEKKSLSITEKLFSMPEFKQAKAVLFYASFGNEVSTKEMVEKGIQNGKQVCVPVTSFKDKTITVSKINSIEELEEKESGLIEPKETKSCPVGEIDVIIVPGIAFDAEGYRIGYGGGFYDRLLRKAPRKTIAIGLCFEQNIDKQLPKQSHDAKMDFVITEERVIKCE